VTAASPVPERRRSRPGSLERPVNARLYRGTWLLVGLPLLLLAFSVARPPALQAPNLPPAFDASQAASLATDLASNYPERQPGTPGATGAAAWFRRQLQPYGFHVRSERFTATIAARDKPDLTHRLEQLVAPPGFTGRAPGGPSRWSTERSGEWQPLRPELVVEVRYDQVTDRRFRHGTTLLRWRPDKAPRQCTFDQLPAAAGDGALSLLEQNPSGIASSLRSSQ